MRIAVMGAGAVGGFFGAKLAAAGHELAFIARGRHLAAMCRTGLLIESVGGDRLAARGLFTSEPRDFGDSDLVLFCVKSYDTESAAESIAPLIGSTTLILSLQNGIDNAKILARRWGASRTIAGVVYIGAQLAAPGVIVHSSGGKIVFGQPGEHRNSATTKIEQILTAAAISCSVSNNIETVQWTKLLWNAPFCAIGALARAPVDQILESDELRRLALDCMTEVQAAALACHIVLPDSRLQETIDFSAGLGRFKPSMLQDLEAGKPLEYEAFNGAVMKRLQSVGKAAPINQCFYALLRQLDQQSRAEAVGQQ
jgi:2-dehydropantoate 2-reductase